MPATYSDEMNLDQAPVSGFETVSFLEPPLLRRKGLPEHARSATGHAPTDVSQILIPRQSAHCRLREGRGIESWAAEALRCFGIRKTRRQTNDRINVNFQRQLPGEIVVSEPTS